MTDYLRDTSTRHILNLDKVEVTTMLPLGLQRATVQVTEDVVHDMLVARLTAYVMSEHLADDTVTAEQRVPATWRDHARQTFAEWVDRLSERDLARKPFEWWLRRHPIGYSTVTLSATWTRRATRPESNIRTPDLGPVVYQESVSHSLRWDQP